MSEHVETPKSRSCRICGEAISTHAAKCKHCSSFQNIWRNSIVQIGAYTGFITLIASGLTYIYATAKDVYRDAHPIQIVAFSHAEGGTFLNVSDISVYLDEISISLDAKHAYSQHIHKIANPSEFISTGTPINITIKQLKDGGASVWPKALTQDEACFQIDFKFPYESGKKANVKLYYFNSTDGYRREKAFDLEAILIPADGNPCKLPLEIYR